MSQLRPWYCEYEIHEDGRVRLRVVWSETPTVSHSRDVSFSALDQLPPLLRQAVESDRLGHGAETGTFDFPEGWGTTELEAIIAAPDTGRSRSRRRHSTAS